MLQLWASPLSGRQPSDKKVYLQSLLIRVSAWCDARLESAFKNTSRKSAACSLISICVTHTSLFKDGLSFGRVPTSTELLAAGWWTPTERKSSGFNSLHSALSRFRRSAAASVAQTANILWFSHYFQNERREVSLQPPLRWKHIHSFYQWEWKLLHRWSFSGIVNHIAILKSVKWITTWVILIYFVLKGSRKESVPRNKTLKDPVEGFSDI